MTRLAALLALLLAAFAATAASAAARHMNVTLLPETRSVAPGESVTLAFLMRPQPGWHGYWRNPGDAGTEPRVAWRLDNGWRADPLLYPVPRRLTIAGLMNYVFEGDYALLATLRVPADAEPGVVVPVDARLDYLVCTESLCVPETANVSTELTVGGPPASRDARFDRFRQALPRPLGQPARFAVSGGRLRLAIPFPRGAAIADPYVYPVTQEAVRYAAPQSVSRNGDTLVVETEADEGAARLASFDGVLAIGEGAGLSFTARLGEVPPAGTPIAGTAAAPGASPADAGAILFALLGALAGGLLLNVMPCVFPILGLKALSLARAGNGAHARREALAYAAGVVGTCLALGIALLALRAGGSAAGWAFQLQDPRVILLLLLLVTAIALNLAGLFELPVITAGESLTQGGGARAAFFTGALAAFVATPCAGPFLGVALGAALVLPLWAGIAVFVGLGLGLALPFLALGFVPALRRWLPKPGPWMRTLQRLLSVPMFVTALGLAWVLGRESGADGMAIGLGAALLLGLALWWFGVRQGRRATWPALALVAVAVIGSLPFVRLAPAEAAQAVASGALATEPFDETRLAALRAANTPVFLYFTADWCLTCKVNERVAIDRAEVADAFRARGVKVLMGDWTRGDPAISAFLAAHGRSGVPYYLYYPPGAEPRELPQILTPATLVEMVAN